MKMSTIDINANDVNGTPVDYTDKRVAFGAPPIIQVGVGRHLATEPEDGGYFRSTLIYIIFRVVTVISHGTWSLLAVNEEYYALLGAGMRRHHLPHCSQVQSVLTWRV